MNDETKAAIELWRETAKKPCRCLDCTAVRSILAHIDGEPARLAAAREEQAAESDRAFHAALVGDTSYTASLTATPLADEIAALRAQNDELREHLREKESQRLSAHTENETLRARVAELEHALRDTSQAHVETGKLREEAEAERDALRAERDEVTMLLSGALHWTVASELMAANHTRAAHAVVDELAALRARVAELEAQVEAQRASSQRHMNGRESYWLEQRVKWIAEHDRYAESCKWHADRAEKAEAQVAAARAACARLVDRPWSRWAGDAARDVLRALDEATKK